MSELRMLMRVEGMTCEGCSQTVEQGLRREAGVKEAHVSWEEGLAEVSFDPAETDEQQVLASRVFRRQYSAQRVSTGCC